MFLKVLAGICLVVVPIGVVMAGRDADLEGKAKVPVEADVTFVSFDRHAASVDIWGTWVLDKEITARTSPDTKAESYKGVEWVFEKDAESTARIKEQLPKILAVVKQGKPKNYPGIKRGLQEVYATGKLSINKPKRQMRGDFALIIYFGEPCILILRKKRNGKYDWESVYYRFIYDSDSDNDFLFLGGDFLNEPFRAYKRKPAED